MIRDWWRLLTGHNGPRTHSNVSGPLLVVTRFGTAQRREHGIVQQLDSLLDAVLQGEVRQQVAGASRWWQASVASERLLSNVKHLLRPLRAIAHVQQTRQCHLANVHHLLARNSRHAGIDTVSQAGLVPVVPVANTSRKISGSGQVRGVCSRPHLAGEREPRHNRLRVTNIVANKYQDVIIVGRPLNSQKILQIQIGRHSNNTPPELQS